MYYKLLKILFSGKDEQIIENANLLMQLISGTFDAMFETVLTHLENFKKHDPNPEISDKAVVVNTVLRMSLSKITSIAVLEKSGVTIPELNCMDKDLHFLLNVRSYLTPFILKVNDFLFDQHIMNQKTSSKTIQERVMPYINWDARIIKCDLANMDVRYTIVSFKR
ncbi:hypothetical protein BA6E_125240 [Bacteroidales bacterium 6E]|nr:hypothetical protein BA6E_125240 [Bacteroidales bacterium 6E]